MAEFRKLPTQQELQQLLYMQGLKPQSTQEILQQNLAPQTIAPIPQNVFQKIAGGAKAAGEMVNRVGTAADVAKLFPGYTGQTQVNIPTGFNFAPKQDPAGGVIPQGLQTQPVNVNQLLQAIKPADVLGISGAERAYGDIGMGKVPNAMDVVDTLALGAGGIAAGKAAVKGVQATKGLPVGMSIQDVGGLLKEAPRSPLGFYSALEDTALNLQRNKGTGQAFLNDLQKGANVKAEEIKWTGLDEFLKDKPNVTKQEVQDYLANNRVDVQEVRSTVPRLPGEGMPGDKGEFLPKFGQYTLPGGENYREILLTLPQVGQVDSRVARLNAAIEERKAMTAMAADLKRSNDPLAQDKLAEMRVKYSEKENEIADLRQQIKNAGLVKEEYLSSHFNQPNILAHLRVNDRVDADGKKMLLIEEVQSDWHQAGREKGYGGITAYNIMDKDGTWYNQTRDKDFAEKQANEIGGFVKEKKLKGIPDAPFKDSWYQLALKRAIQYAAENGYERIGLTTGRQQADRFDLSKQVDELNYKKNADGTYKLSAQTGGMGNMIGENIPESKLADYVGKEVAQKIIDNAGNEVNFGGSGSVSQPKDIWKGLSGIDLKIGGEGMKKYYDEIYPKFLDKYGKKWNAKVGEIAIGSATSGNAKDRVIFAGQKFKTTDGKLWDDYDEALNHESSITVSPTVRYLDVTPEMKASVSKGQPLFQAIPAATTGGLLGAQEERK